MGYFSNIKYSIESTLISQDFTAVKMKMKTHKKTESSKFKKSRNLLEMFCSPFTH